MLGTEVHARKPIISEAKNVPASFGHLKERIRSAS